MGFENAMLDAEEEAGAWAKLSDMEDPLSKSIKARYSPSQVNVLDRYVFNFVPPIENVFPDVSNEDSKQLLALMTDFLETYDTTVGEDIANISKVNDPTLKQKAKVLINKIDSI